MSMMTDRSLWIRTLIWSAVVMLCILGVRTTAVQDTAWPGEAWSGTPRVERVDCTTLEGVQIPTGKPAECGYLYVAENRDEPERRTLRLVFAILKSTNPDPAPNPVVFLTGGPGRGALGSESWWFEFPTLARRDFVLLDPRGTGLSEPDMTCEDLPVVDATYQDRPPSIEEDTADRRRWAIQCRDSLLREGLDLTAYNTLTNVQDLEDLRQALGYDQWNLYAMSYGVRWALSAIREYPEGIRSVVLDSGIPLQVNHQAEAPDIRAEAFATLFAGCESDPACRAAYPELESVFYDLVERFTSEPIRIAAQDETGRKIQAWFTGNSLINGAYDSLYDQSLIPLLPLAAYEIRDGNQAVIETLGERIGSFGIAEGLFDLVICHDDIAFLNVEEFKTSVAEHPRLASYWEGYDYDKICELWGAGRADPESRQAVRSEIPALVLAGQYDPVTPPRYGREIVSTLSQGHFYEFPHMTHGVTFLHSCPADMMAAFVDDPTAALDASCMADIGDIPFVTDVYINPGVYNLSKALFITPNILLLGVVASCSLLLLSVVVSFPIAYLLARRRSVSWTFRPLPFLAVILLWLVSVLNMVFSAALVVTLMDIAATNENLLLFGLPSAAAGWFVLPWVATVFTLAVVALSAVAWIRGWWRLAGRIYYSLATGAVLGFIGLLFCLGLLRF